MNEVSIIGTGKYVPERIVTNVDLSSVVDTNDEWISTRTGIRQRRVSEEDNTSDIACKAAINALKSANVHPEDIDLIITATATPDCFVPSTACIVQSKIKACNAVCFDVSAACSGFIYGLCIAEQFIKNGMYNTALVIGAEMLSKIVDWKDRSTCILFGDGGGAAVVRKSDKKGIISSYLGSNGDKCEYLKCPAVPVRNLYKTCPNDTYNFVTMNGKEIFKFGVKIIPHSVEKVLEGTGYTVDDIKYIIPHQANIRIIEAAAKKLGVSEDKFYTNIHKFGNTSAGSIPIALDELAKDKKLESGDKIILVGFGGGLTWGAVMIEWL